eukprot:GHVS01037576.1.p1 GENE.GHVS01037576.1~~GHVS01037576.1.p1  ORF type:complete len:338 (-),score=98.61 GHVS01037576.1:459-1472(-)
MYNPLMHILHIPHHCHLLHNTTLLTYTLQTAPSTIHTLRIHTTLTHHTHHPPYSVDTTTLCSSTLSASTTTTLSSSLLLSPLLLPPPPLNMSWSSHPLLGLPYHKSSPMVCVHTPQGPSYIPMLTTNCEQTTDASPPPPYQLPNSNATIFWGGVSSGLRGTRGNGNGSTENYCFNGISCNGLSGMQSSAAMTSIDEGMTHEQFDSDEGVSVTPASTPSSYSSPPPFFSQIKTFTPVDEQHSCLDCTPAHRAGGGGCPSSSSDLSCEAFVCLRGKRSFDALNSLGEGSCGGQYGRGGGRMVEGAGGGGGSKERRLADRDMTDKTSQTSHRGVCDIVMF